MRIRRDDADEGDVISTSSLVDILFILIIFFLVTTSFREEERDITVNLPETDTALAAATQVLVVNVRDDGSFYLGEDRVDLPSLQSMLGDAVRMNPNQKVLIRGDRNALHGNVAAALSTCKRVGIREANIGYMTSGS
ncbi:MAG: ExbD/TolR family protein [Verrucomicrobiota bacterium]